MKAILSHISFIQTLKMSGLLFLVNVIFGLDAMSLERKKKTVKSVKEVVVAISFSDVVLADVFLQIENETNFTFSYSPSDLNRKFRFTETYEHVSVEKILLDLSKQANLKFRQINNNISVSKIKRSEKSSDSRINIELGLLEISGVITNEKGDVIPGANIKIIGTTEGTISNADGTYSLVAEKGAHLSYTFIGYLRKEIEIEQSTGIDVSMVQNVETLESVVVLGSRNPYRSVVDSSIPVDVISLDEITNVTAHVALNDLLNYSVPSFTSQSQTVADETDHIDPASLRGLGPDQVLILINGKRRHTTSLVNTNGTVGAGSVGTDLNAIPISAIEKIEVLRDGASAQYGSDAIAGVINLVLKKTTNQLDLSLTGGVNSSKYGNQFEGGADGEKFQLDANYGLHLGDKGGFLNFTGSLAMRNPALRNQNYSGDIYRGYHAAERVFAENGGIVEHMSLADYQTAAQSIAYLEDAVKTQIDGLDVNTNQGALDLNAILDIDVDEEELMARGLTREDFRFKVGTSSYRDGKFFTNLSIPLGYRSEMYAFGGISFRQGVSYGFYRRPAQPDGRANTLAFADGFLPSIGSDIMDRSLAFGIKGLINDWNVDFSNTSGSNTFNVSVGNSSNSTLRGSTPRTFDAGGFGFFQNTVNLDVSRFNTEILEGLNVAFGAEYKFEKFQITAGEEASYSSYDLNGEVVTPSTSPSLFVYHPFLRSESTTTPGEIEQVRLGGGAQVYRGLDPDNAINKSRNSFAGYLDLELNIIPEWIIGAAGRFESFSDFGTAVNYKISSRYHIIDGLSVRIAQSTGFRAPSLHQQYFSRTSTIFQGNMPVENATFTNDSRAADLLHIPKLKQETSASLSAGLMAQFAGFTFTLDAYSIHIEDRIVYSGSFGAGDSPELQSIFTLSGANEARFFINAIDTESRGVDVVLSRTVNVNQSIAVKNDFAATFSKTEVLAVKVPDVLKEANLHGSFFDGQEEAFLTVAQPRTKLNLTHQLDFGNWKMMIRNVFFGSVIDPDDFEGVERMANRTASSDARYGGKIITDASISTKWGKQLLLTLGINNLLDIYPDENMDSGTSGDQFIYSRRTSQFGYAGRYLFAKLNFMIN